MIKKIGFDYILQGAGIIISIVTAPIFLKIAGESNYSRWTIILSYIGLLGISDVGFGPNFIRCYKVSNSFSNTQKIFTNSLTLFLILSVIISTILIIFLKIHDPKIVVFLMLITCLFNVFGLSEYLLIISEKYTQYSLITSAIQIGSPLLSILLLYFFRNINAFLLSYFSIRLLIFLYISLNEKWWTLLDIKKIKIIEFKNILNYSFWFFISKSNRLIKDHLDIILISYFLNERLILVYTFSVKIPLLLQSLLIRPSNFFVNNISNEVSKNNSYFIEEYFIKIYKIILFTTPLIALFYFYLIEYTIDKWVGVQYFADRNFIIVLFFILIKEVFFHYIGLLFIYTSLKPLAIMQLIEFVLNLLMSICFVKMFGILGLVLATALSSSVFMIFLLPIILKKFIHSIKKSTLLIFKLLLFTIFCSFVLNYLAVINYDSIQLKLLIFSFIFITYGSLFWKKIISAKFNILENNDV